MGDVELSFRFGRWPSYEAPTRCAHNKCAIAFTSLLAQSLPSVVIWKHCGECVIGSDMSLPMENVCCSSSTALGALNGVHLLIYSGDLRTTTDEDSTFKGTRGSREA